MPTRSPRRRRVRVEGKLCGERTSTFELRPRANTPAAMVARAWSGLMCLETQGPREGRQTLVLGGVAENLTRGQVNSTYVSEDPCSKPRLRLVAARHARDQPLGRNVATGHPATDGPEVTRGKRREGAREAFVRCFELRPTKGDMLSNLGNIAAMRVCARAWLGTSHDFA